MKKAILNLHCTEPIILVVMVCMTLLFFNIVSHNFPLGFEIILLFVEIKKKKTLIKLVYIITTNKRDK